MSESTPRRLNLSADREAKRIVDRITGKTTEADDIKLIIRKGEKLMQEKFEKGEVILECLQYLEYWQKKLDKLG